jgi:hypothetical protein
MGIDPISIGIMAAGALVQGYGAIKGAAAQKRMQRAEQSRADMEAQNQRLEQVRQGRIAKAKAIQAGENQGVGNSSSVTAGANNATGEANSNIGYINAQQDVGSQIRTAQGQMNDAQGIASIGGAITNIGGTVFENDKYISQKAKNIFG